MSYPTRHTIDVTTAADGTATVYSNALHGAIVGIQYVKAGSGGFSDGVDFDVTLETSGKVVWDEDNVNASKFLKGPVEPASLTSGSDSTLTELPIFVAGERLKFAITNGGATKTGQFIIITA